jgi:hypothetical protein
MSARESERRLILDMIANGKISASEGLRLLNALGEVSEPAPEAGEETRLGDGAEAPLAVQAGPAVSPADASSPAAETPTAGPSSEETLHTAATPHPMPPEFERWRRWWMVPLWVGVGVTIFGAALLFWVTQRAGVGFWFFCATVPFLSGLAVMVLAYQSRTAHWLHMRIHQRRDEWPRRINLSFPLPIRLTAWFLNRFGDRIPGLQATSLDEVIQALDHTTTPENPIYLQVDEGEDGERVEIFIG